MMCDRLECARQMPAKLFTASWQSGTIVAQSRSLLPIFKDDSAFHIARIFLDSDFEKNDNKKTYFGFKIKRQHTWNNNESSAMSSEREKMFYLSRKWKKY